MQEEVINKLREWLRGTPENPGLLVQKGFTVENFARAVGKRRATLYYMIEGSNQPSEETLRKMCEVLGVSYEEGLKHATPRAANRPSLGLGKSKSGKKRRLLGDVLQK